MRNSHAMTNCIIDLADLGLLKVSGSRAKELLQGQLTCNLDDITPSQTRLGAHCNPQGRIISFFRLINHQNNYYLLMPKTLIPYALAPLKKYAVFFKVDLEDASGRFVRMGYCGNQLEQYIQPIPLEVDALTEVNDLFIIKLSNQRYEIIGTRDAVSKCWKSLLEKNSVESTENWKYLTITAGIPAIYPETTEKFLPHDLNLHQINAISFTKGCYTGQEIIARMQYRGKLKNHMRMVDMQSDTEPKPGQDIYSDKGIVSSIVDFCKTGYNNYRMLIVTNADPYP